MMSQYFPLLVVIAFVAVGIAAWLGLRLQRDSESATRAKGNPSWRPYLIPHERLKLAEPPALPHQHNVLVLTTLAFSIVLGGMLAALAIHDALAPPPLDLSSVAHLLDERLPTQALAERRQLELIAAIRSVPVANGSSADLTRLETILIAHLPGPEETERRQKELLAAIKLASTTTQPSPVLVSSTTRATFSWTVLSILLFAFSYAAYSYAFSPTVRPSDASR
jgi:hypothetical protein